MKKLKLDELNRLTVSEFKETDKIPVVIVLDNIRSGMNVGSFFRTADAYACEKIILTGICPVPPHKEINKTAIGADASMDWEYVENTVDALINLKAQGYQIISVEQTDSSVPLHNYSHLNIVKLAVVFGNEVDGVSDQAISLSDHCIEIPQYGTKHSLNVSVCGGTVLYELNNYYRQS